MPLINELSAASSLQGGEAVPVYQGSSTVRTTVAAIAASGPPAAHTHTADEIEYGAGTVEDALSDIEDDLSLSSVLTRNATTTDNSAAGYAAFSVIQNSTTRRLDMCFDPATSALWLRMGIETRLPIRSGRLYPCHYGATISTIAVPAADRLQLYPFGIYEKETISALSLWIQTGGTGSSVKMCLYASDPITGLPTGTPLKSDTTGAATTASGAAATFTFATPQVCEPGIYWVGHKDTGTLPTYISIASQSTSVSYLTGRSGLLAANAATSLYVSDTYSAAFPDLTSASYTDNLNGGVAVIYRTIA